MSVGPDKTCWPGAVWLHLSWCDCWPRLQDGYASSATQLESIAPTQAVAATDAHAPPPHLPLPARQQQQQQQQRWGLPPEQAAYFASLDQECLLETASAQTTPAASRAASPGPAAAAAGFAGPCTAPQADLAAVITQQLASQRQHTPCSEEIRRHFPHVEVGAGCRWLAAAALPAACGP